MGAEHDRIERREINTSCGHEVSRQSTGAQPKRQPEPCHCSSGLIAKERHLRHALHHRQAQSTSPRATRRLPERPRSSRNAEIVEVSTAPSRAGPRGSAPSKPDVAWTPTSVNAAEREVADGVDRFAPMALLQRPHELHYQLHRRRGGQRSVGGPLRGACERRHR